MNENINLVEILKNCPKETKLYSTVHGDVEFLHISYNNKYPIKIYYSNRQITSVTKSGKLYDDYLDSECILFPSKDQRDWSKFKLPIPIDTPVMYSDNNSWYLGHYAGNNKVFSFGRKAANKLEVSPWRYIVPVSNFNFNDTESNKEKSI